MAKTKFEKLPPSHQREYNTWIVDAKQPETRRKRAAKAVEMIMDKKGLSRIRLEAKLPV